MNYLAIIVITFVSGVIGTGLGGFVGAIFKKDSRKIVSLLLAFAGGVMLAVVCFDLMTSPLETFSNELLIKLTPLFIILSVAIGYLIIWALNTWIDKKTNREIAHTEDTSHPKTADDLDELIHADHYEKHIQQKDHLFIAGLVMMFAIALHNLPEGMVIGASYAKTDNLLDNIFSGSGFIMAIIIGLHNIPEGMAVSVPLISGGMKKTKAVFLTALSGAPTIIGALIGFALGEMNPFMSLISLGFASGAMLYVILGELLPEAILMYKSKLPAFATLIGILLGFVLVFI